MLVSGAFLQVCPIQSAFEPGFHRGKQGLKSVGGGRLLSTVKAYDGLGPGPKYRNWPRSDLSGYFLPSSGGGGGGGGGGGTPRLSGVWADSGGAEVVEVVPLQPDVSRQPPAANTTMASRGEIECSRGILIWQDSSLRIELLD